MYQLLEGHHLPFVFSPPFSILPNEIDAKMACFKTPFWRLIRLLFFVPSFTIGNFRKNVKPTSAHEQAEVARSGSRSDPAQTLQHPNRAGLL